MSDLIRERIFSQEYEEEQKIPRKIPRMIEPRSLIQPLKIMKLKRFSESKTVNPWESDCRSLIEDYNLKVKNPNQIYKQIIGDTFTEFDGAYSGFKIILFYKTSGGDDKLLKDYGEIVSSSNIHKLIFFIRPERDEAFAATTGKAYAVVKRYVDYEFSDRIAARLASLKGVEELEQVDLLGISRKTILSFKSPELINPLNLGCITTSFTVQFRPTASIFRLPGFQDQSGVPILGMRAEFKPASVTIKHRFTIQDYADIMTHFSSIYRGEKTFEYFNLDNTLQSENIDTKSSILSESDSEIYKPNLTLIPYDKGEQLNKILESKLENFNFVANTSNNTDIQSMAFRYRYAWEWFSGDCFELVRNNQTIKSWPKPPSLLQVIQEVKESSAAETNYFSKYLFRFQSICNDPESENEESVFNYVQGMMIHNGEVFWRAVKCWYSMTDDYCCLIQRQLSKLLDECLLDRTSPFALNKPWPNSKELEEKKLKLKADGIKKNLDVEGEYNTMYGAEVNYLVGDKVLARQIEVFDLLYFEPSSKTTAIYHVKYGFNQVTRDACSQIINSAKVIAGSLMSTSDNDSLDVLYPKLHPKKFEIFSDKVEFKEALLKSTIIYAVVTKKSLHEERHVKWKVELPFLENRIQELRISNVDFYKLFNDFVGNLANAIFQEMISHEYITPRGIIKSQFLCCTSDKFFNNCGLVKDQKKAIFKYVVNIYKSNFESMIAKMEVIRVRDELARLGFHGERFKICQIPINS